MASDQLNIDVLLGKLNSLLFRFNSEPNIRANIKYTIQKFYKIPAVRYWLTMNGEKPEGDDEIKEENKHMGIKSFKSWLAEQEEIDSGGSSYQTGGAEIVDTGDSSLGNRVSSTGRYRDIPAANGKKPKGSAKKKKRASKKARKLEHNPGDEESSVTLSFNEKTGEPEFSMTNMSFSNLKSLDEILD